MDTNAWTNVTGCVRGRCLRLAVCVGALGALSGCIDLLAQGLPEGPHIEPGAAVSRPNAKIAAHGGAVDGDGTGIAVVSVAAPVPVHPNVGVQFDALGGGVGGDEAWGVGGHLFWRDPAKGLVGVASRYTEFGGLGVGHVGGEVEKYIGHFSLLGQTGWRYGDGVDNGAYGRVEGRIYMTENLYVGGGAELAEDLELARFGAELQPDLGRLSNPSLNLKGLSVFIDGSVGSDDRYSVLSGLRLHLGDDKSLIRRHREDDPTERNSEDLDVIGDKDGKRCPPVKEVYEQMEEPMDGCEQQEIYEIN